MGRGRVLFCMSYGHTEWGSEMSMNECLHSKRGHSEKRGSQEHRRGTQDEEDLGFSGQNHYIEQISMTSVVLKKKLYGFTITLEAKFTFPENSLCSRSRYI